MRTSTCESLATFIGSYVVLLECAAGEPPSARPLTTFAEPAWTPQTIFSSGTPGRWSSEQVLFANAAGLQVAPLAGGSPFVIDPGVTTGTGVFGAFVPGGSVLYVTPGGAFERAAVGPSSEPTTLVASGIDGLTSVSPDGQHAVLSGSQNPQNGFTDLRLASTTTAGAPVVVSSTPTNDSYGFTTDSSQILYLTDVSATTSVGALYSRPVDPSGVPVLLSQTSVGGIRSTGPTGVLFMDNPDLSAGPAWTVADLEWVDVAPSAAPTHIASRLEPMGGYPSPSYVYSQALGGAVYVAAMPSGGGLGLYVTKLP